MIDRDHALPVARQAKLVGISRSSVYYVPNPVSDADLALMRRIDELHLERIRQRNPSGPFPAVRCRRFFAVKRRKHASDHRCH
jgi:hypothetical protein